MRRSPDSQSWRTHSLFCVLLTLCTAGCGEIPETDSESPQFHDAEEEAAHADYMQAMPDNDRAMKLQGELSRRIMEELDEADRTKAEAALNKIRTEYERRVETEGSRIGASKWLRETLEQLTVESLVHPPARAEPATR